jgi:hypothetical protein
MHAHCVILRATDRALRRGVGLAFALTSAASPALARDGEPVGLAPGFAALSRMEAVTATAYGPDALLYNPAGLARPVWNLTLVEHYEAIDQEAIDMSRRFQRDFESGEDPDLTDVYQVLDSGKEFSFELGNTVLALNVPYAGLGGFAYTRTSVQHETDEDGVDRYDLDTLANAGFALGGAFTFGKVTLGWSRYYLLRAKLETDPPVATVRELAERAEAGEEIEVEDVPHAEWTRLETGNAFGDNAGLLVRPWDDNPSGLGIAVLNVGGTRFQREPLIKRKDVEKADARLDEFATKNELTLENPEPLPQIVNVGLSVGYGGGTNDYVGALIDVDYQDLDVDGDGAKSGEAVEHKLAGSSELALQLPPDVAKKFSVPVAIDKKKHVYWVGFQRVRAMSGAREGDASAYGFDLKLLIGVDQIAPLSVSFGHYVHESMAGGHRRQGWMADLALSMTL